MRGRGSNLRYTMLEGLYVTLTQNIREAGFLCYLNNFPDESQKLQLRYIDSQAILIWKS
jgi:hypothetical protein